VWLTVRARRLTLGSNDSVGTTIDTASLLCAAAEGGPKRRQLFPQKRLLTRPFGLILFTSAATLSRSPSSAWCFTTPAMIGFGTTQL